MKTILLMCVVGMSGICCYAHTDGAGNTDECATDVDCGLVDNVCVRRTCVAGTCAEVYAPPNTRCDANAAGNVGWCSQGSCGYTCEPSHDEQCDDGDPCTADECFGLVCIHGKATTCQ